MSFLRFQGSPATGGIISRRYERVQPVKLSLCHRSSGKKLREIGYFQIKKPFSIIVHYPLVRF